MKKKFKKIENKTFIQRIEELQKKMATTEEFTKI